MITCIYYHENSNQTIRYIEKIARNSDNLKRRPSYYKVEETDSISPTPNLSVRDPLNSLQYDTNYTQYCEIIVTTWGNVLM